MAPVAIVEEAPLAPAAPRADSTPYLFLALGGLLALALAIWGFVAIGRRKPVARQAKVEIQRPVTSSTVSLEPLVATPQAAAEPLVATPTPSVHEFRPTAPTPAASLAHTGASVALPRTMPGSYEERDALMRRMIAAKPDRANPFTTYQARQKRARLILQSLGRDFSNTEPWIDLSQYPANWPELAGRKYAAA